MSLAAEKDVDSRRGTVDLLLCRTRLRNDVIVREEDNGHLYYCPETDHLHFVSNEAASFLERLDGTRTVESAIQDLTEPLDGQEAEKAKWMALLLVSDFVDRKLFEV